MGACKLAILTYNVTSKDEKFWTKLYETEISIVCDVLISVLLFVLPLLKASDT